MKIAIEYHVDPYPHSKKASKLLYNLRISAINSPYH